MRAFFVLLDKHLSEKLDSEARFVVSVHIRRWMKEKLEGDTDHALQHRTLFMLASPSTRGANVQKCYM